MSRAQNQCQCENLNLPNAAATDHEETYLTEVRLVTCGCGTLRTYIRSIYSTVPRFFTSVFSRDLTTAVRLQQTCTAISA